MSSDIKTFGCARWRCLKVNPDWLAFGVGDPIKRTYCLDHIPLIVRLKMRLRAARPVSSTGTGGEAT